MDENRNEQEQEQQPANNKLAEEEGLLKAYKALEATTVPKDKYERDVNELKAKNDLYLKAITEGKRIETENDIDLVERIKELNKFKGTNLAYFEKLCPAIDALLEQMPKSDIIKISGDDGLQEMIKVNEQMKQMVKDADGDADYFLNLFNKRVNDSAGKISAEIERAGSLANYLSEQQKSKKGR